MGFAIVGRKMNYVYYEDAESKTRIKIPQENYIGCIRSEEPEQIQWPVGYLRALRNPHGTKRLRDIALGRKYERRLSVGGGIWGGGMMFSRIVVQTEGKEILGEFGVTAKEYQKGGKYELAFGLIDS